jgi:Divergent InlB B-repeat domain
MHRTRKLVLVGIMGATTTISVFMGQETLTPSQNAAEFSLTIEKGNPSGNYAAGTVVTVGAEAPSSGAQFTGWTGDTAILANPSQPTTTATIPFMAVSITATYTAPATNSPSTSAPVAPATPAANSVSTHQARWEG